MDWGVRLLQGNRDGESPGLERVAPLLCFPSGPVVELVSSVSQRLCLLTPDLDQLCLLPHHSPALQVPLIPSIPRGSSPHLSAVPSRPPTPLLDPPGCLWDHGEQPCDLHELSRGHRGAEVPKCGQNHASHRGEPPPSGNPSPQPPVETHPPPPAGSSPSLARGSLCGLRPERKS